VCINRTSLFSRRPPKCKVVLIKESLCTLGSPLRWELVGTPIELSRPKVVDLPLRPNSILLKIHSFIPYLFRFDNWYRAAGHLDTYVPAWKSTVTYRSLSYWSGGFPWPVEAFSLTEACSSPPLLPVRAAQISPARSSTKCVPDHWCLQIFSDSRLGVRPPPPCPPFLVPPGAPRPSVIPQGPTPAREQHLTGLPIRSPARKFYQTVGPVVSYLVVELTARSPFYGNHINPTPALISKIHARPEPPALEVKREGWH